jgi:hypothetical protein
MIGLFLIIIGIGIIWIPAHIWQYVIGIFLILLVSCLLQKAGRNQPESGFF